MGRKAKYIEILTEDQKSSLQKGYSYGKSVLFRRKCHSILLSHAGKTAKEIADFFGVTKTSVLIWFRQWEAKGIKGLELQAGRGRKPKLKTEDSKQVKVVKTLIENECQNLNPVVAQIEEQLGIKLSKKTLKRFLKNLTTDGNVSVNE